MRPPSLRRPGALIGCGVLLALLGVSPWGLWERDEGRYADAARGMLESRDFVTPRIDGAVFLDKPPLVYWVTAASLALWGVGETGARFGQVLFAAGVLLVTRRIGSRLWDRRRGNAALVILASSLLFFAAGHILTLDLALTFFVSLTLLLFLEGREGSPGSRARLGMFAAAAGAVLTKGPVGLLLPALAIACTLVPKAEWRSAARLPWLRGTLLFSAIVAPWYVAVSIANPAFPRHFFVHEHLERFATGVHRHPGAPWYYLAVLAAGLLPWSLLLPPRLIRSRARPSETTGDRRGDARAFLWAWLAPGLVLFTLSQSKLAFYVLPLLPAAALLMAPAIVRELEESRRRPVFVWPSCYLALVGVGAIVLGARREDWDYLARSGIGWPLVAFVLLATGCALLLGDLLARRGRVLAALLSLALLWLAACYAVFGVVSRLDYFNATKRFATLVRAERTGAEPVYAYRCYLRGLPFYLDETVGLVSPHSDDLRLARSIGHDSGTFIDEADFLERARGDGRIFAVLRRGEVEALEARVGRPLPVLAISQSYALVSNRLSAPGPK